MTENFTSVWRITCQYNRLKRTRQFNFWKDNLNELFYLLISFLDFILLNKSLFIILNLYFYSLKLYYIKYPLELLVII